MPLVLVPVLVLVLVLLTILPDAHRLMFEQRSTILEHATAPFARHFLSLRRWWLIRVAHITSTRLPGLLYLVLREPLGGLSIDRIAAAAAFAAGPAALGEKTVDLVDEDDAGLVFASFNEKFSDAFGAEADPHFVEIGA